MEQDRNSNRINLIMNEADVDTSAFGVLSGLTFSASVLIFSFRNSMSYGDLYLTLTLISTVLFVFATVLASDAAGRTRLGKSADAEKILKRVAIIGGMGFFMLLFDIASIAFSAGLFIGIIVVLVTIVVLWFSMTW